MRDSARRMLVSAVCVLGLAAVAAPVLSTAAASPAAAASVAAGSSSLPTPGLYHQPIIGKVVLPGLGQVLGHGVRHATNVQSQNWSGYADNQDTYNSVAASWIQPAVNCSAGGGGGGGILNGLLGGNGLGNLLGPGSSAASFWVGLDGYSSNSVEQLGADSDCNGKTPTYYAWWEMFPNPSQVLSSSYPVHPGDQMTAWVASNGSGTTFFLALKDATAGWFFGTTQNASPGFGRSSAEVVAEAPFVVQHPVLQRVAALGLRPGGLRQRRPHRQLRQQRLARRLQRQRDHHDGRQQDARRSEQPQCRRPFVLRLLAELVTARVPMPADRTLFKFFPS